MIFSSTIIAHFLFPFNQRCSIQLFPPVLPFTQPIRKILSKHALLVKSASAQFLCRWWWGEGVSLDLRQKIQQRSFWQGMEKQFWERKDPALTWSLVESILPLKKDFDYFEIIQFTEIRGMRMRERHWLISDRGIWNVEGWHLAKASVKDHSSPCSHDAKAINP